MVDLYIAGGLVGIVVIVYLLSRMKFLTKKSLPYVALGLLAALGFGYFKLRRMDSAKKKIKEIKKKIKDIEENKLKPLEEKDKNLTHELNEIRTKLDDKLAAHEKQTLLDQAKTKEEFKRIEKLSGQELHNEAEKALDLSDIE